MRITVVVPHYNDTKHLAECVASVQEDEPIEVLVVDDASTDPDVPQRLSDLEAAGVRVIRQPVNSGPADAITRGAAAARGRFLFRLDSDDLLLPGTLKRLADALDAAPGVDFVYGDFELIGAAQGTMRSYEWEPWRAVYASCWPSALMIRTSTLLEVGGVPSRSPFEDWDLYMTLAEQEKTGRRIPGLAYRYRVGGDDRRFNANRDRLRAETKRLRELHPRLWSRRHTMQREAAVPVWIRVSYPVVYDLRTRLPPWASDAVFGLLAMLRRAYHRLRGS